MQTISKRAYEEVFHTHNFRRPDGKGWLASDETLSSPSVIVQDADGVTQATMVSDVSVVSSIYVKYKLKGGTSGAQYTVLIRAESSAGNKFEDDLTLDIE